MAQKKVPMAKRSAQLLRRAGIRDANGKTVLVFSILLLLLLAVLVLKLRPFSQNALAQQLEDAGVSSLSVNEDASESLGLSVYVSGAIANPGVYSLPDKSRVIDAIQLAGGAMEGAALDSINLARYVLDAEHIHIPYQDELESQLASSGKSYDGLIDLNTASSEDLQELPGIGEAIARKIIAYRDKNGSFKSIEELMEVSGIGQAKYEEIKELVCVNR